MKKLRLKKYRIFLCTHFVFIEFNDCWNTLCLTEEPICMNGEVIETKSEDGCCTEKTCNCDNFVWPPVDQPFCDSKEDCRDGQICDGCQSSMCNCEGICLSDCRPYCQGKLLHCCFREKI